MKTLLKNALLYDGSGEAPGKSDVLIAGESIAEVGQGLDCADAQTIDLEGLSLAPGFIDAHSHNDWFAIKKQPLPYFEPFVRQGITSFVAGNCGLSAAGFEHESAYKDKLGGGLFHLEDVTGEYAAPAEFFDAVDRNMPMNMALLLGHCSARTSVAGYENRSLSDPERERMLAILETGLKEGACGVSLGLMYAPGLYAPVEELKEVARLCERYDRPLTVHARAYSAVSMAYPNPLGRPHNLRALDELADIARGTKLKLQYSHAIFVGRRTLKYKDAVLEVIEQMRADGVDAMFDIFASEVGVSVITVILPVWFQALSPRDKKKPLNRLKLSLLIQVSKALLGFGFDNMQIAYVGEGNEQFEGKTVHEIALERKTSDFDAYLHLCEISDYSGRILMRPYNTAEITRDLSRHDQALYMTDAWYEKKGLQYQNIYDTFPLFLHLSLKGEGDTPTRAIRKMTGATADRFSLEHRGYVRSGCFADLAVFDEKKLKDEVPAEGRISGIEAVFINGRRVLDAGELDEAAFATAGRALRAGH